MTGPGSMDNSALQRWLERCGLAHHVQTFTDHAIDFDVLTDLTEDDLRELGLSLGDRKRLHRAIAELAREQAPPEAAPQPAPRRGPEAERRHMTVLFCDLVASTELAARLDPEDLAVVIGGYHAACAEVVKRWDGHIARYMGDGVLVYFGYPKAHEDDAERAVRAGLDLVGAVGRMQATDGAPLRARVGIATGLVMVGELLSSGATQEETVVGETPNLAARLQALAEPDMVVIAPRTRHLVGGLFELADLGEHQLKGFAEPTRAWVVVGEGQAESRFEALHGAMLTPLVGREHELGILLERWAWANDGDGQVVLLAGEPGIGKSRMVRALREALPDETHILSHYGSPHHQNSSLHPVIAWLQRAIKLDRSEPQEVQLEKLEAFLARSGASPDEAVPLVASLLSIPYEARYPALTLSAQREKQRLLEVLVDLVEGFARDRPMLALYEDAHWIDPSTLELLGLVIERVQGLRALVLVTFRPEFTPAWGARAHSTLLPLNRLGRRQGAAVVDRLTGSRTLPPEIRDEIVAKTDGVPLFLEELTKTVLESGLLTDARTRPMPPLAIPATLHDSLMARLDRLAPVKEVAQIGAAIGREFSYQLLAAVAPLAERNLQEVLQQLIDAELVFRRGTPPDATYSFKHALVQEAAYGSLLRSRRQQLHGRIAAVLEQDADVEPEVLAQHYAHAGFAERAVDYWQKAGQRANARSAAAEAVVHLTRGLESLASLPDDASRRRKELDLQTALGRALIAAKGYAADDTGRAFARARELAGELEDGPQLFPVLFGQYLFRLLRGELTVAHEVAQEMMASAQRQQDASSLLIAHRTLGTNLFWLGRPVPALAQIEQALALYDAAQHDQLTKPYMFHPRVLGLDFKSLTLFVLGYPQQAREIGAQALAEARDARHLVTLAVVLQHACIVHQLVGDFDAMRRAAEELLAIATEQGFPFWIAHGTFLRDWARAAQGRDGHDPARLRHDLDAIQEPGATLILPYYYGLLGQVLSRTESAEGEDGAQAFDEALALLDRTDERWFEAEVLRLQGEHHLASARRDEAAAEACFERAIDIARQQEARLWELRATLSLARLWRGRNRRDQARSLLEPVYGWFSEGFDLEELDDARSLLEGMA